LAHGQRQADEHLIEPGVGVPIEQLIERFERPEHRAADAARARVDRVAGQGAADHLRPRLDGG